jgi:hypothetical protein
VLLLLSQPVMQGVLPDAEMRKLQGALAALGNHARATAAAGSSVLVKQAASQQQQQTQITATAGPTGAAAVVKPGATCGVDAVPDAAHAAPAVTPTLGPTTAIPAAAASNASTMRLGTLLEQLEATMSGQASSSSSGSPIRVIVQQLQDCGKRYFKGLGASDTPAMPVVLNVFCAVTDRARLCLTAGAAAEATGEQTTAAATAPAAAAAADSSRVLQEVEGLLVLSAQPVMARLLGEVAGGQQGVQALRTFRDQMAALCSKA